MFRFVDQVSWLACNNEVDKALELLRPHNSVNPLCALHTLHANIMSNVIRSMASDPESLEPAMTFITETENLIKEVEISDERVMLFAKHNMELNTNVDKSPLEGYVPPLRESTIDPKTYSNEQLLLNYKVINQLCSAELAIIKGALQFMTASYVRAVYNIRVGVKGIESLYETYNTEATEQIHPDIIACIKGGYGLFQYALSLVPPALQWILNMLGFGGDRKIGVKNMREAAEYEGRTGYVASFALGAHYVLIGGGLKSRESRLKKYDPLVQRLLDRYPNGTAVLSFVAQVFRKRGDIEAAIRIMETALESAKTKLNAEPKFVCSELSQCYFLIQKYDETIRLMEKILRDSEQKKEFPGRSLSAWVLATTYSIQGRIKERDDVLSRLESYYNLTKKNMPLERFITAKNDIIKRMTNQEERTLFLIVSYFELIYARDRLNEMNVDGQRYFKPLLDILQSHKKKIEDIGNASKDLLAACTFLEAVFERRIGLNYNDVKEKLYTVIDSDLKIEPQWIAFANFEIAEMLWNLPDRNPLAIERALKACSEVKNFPSEDILHSRLKAANRQVAAEKKKQLHHKKHKK
jgi:tetratricopeptide (TPR) repeat protein